MTRFVVDCPQALIDYTQKELAQLSSCGLPSGPDRLHSVHPLVDLPVVVDCPQALIDYTIVECWVMRNPVVDCPQALIDYTDSRVHLKRLRVVDCPQALIDYTPRGTARRCPQLWIDRRP